MSLFKNILLTLIICSGLNCTALVYANTLSKPLVVGIGGLSVARQKHHECFRRMIDRRQHLVLSRPIL